MARKIIKGVLFVLAAVVVAGGIMTYFRSQKKIPEPSFLHSQNSTTGSTTGEQPKMSTIRDIVINSQGQGAQVEIKGVTEHNYNIQHLESGDGFKIQIPHSQIEQVKRTLENPHPLIKSIEVHELSENPTTAELIFHTEKDVNFLDTQHNDSITIDFVKSEAEGDQTASGSSTSGSAKNLSSGAGDSSDEVAEKPSSSASVKGSSKSKSKSAVGSSSLTSKSSKSSKSKVATSSGSSKKSKGPAIKIKPFDPSMLDEPAPTTLSGSNTGSMGSNPSPTSGGSSGSKTLSDDLADSDIKTPSPAGSTSDSKTTSAAGLDRVETPTALATLGGAKPSTESFGGSTNEPPVITNTKKPTEEDDGFNLNEAVKEFGVQDKGGPAKGAPSTATPANDAKKAPAAGTNLLDAETQLSMKDGSFNNGQQVAALPQNQKFDLNKVQANLPALQNLTVQKTDTGSIVTFEREKNIPYKVFRMVNPSRIVVDFKDAKSQLKPDYPRFAGTKISRVETREYAGVDGMLVRVILYVDGAPSFKASKSGNQLVLDIQ